MRVVHRKTATITVSERQERQTRRGVIALVQVMSVSLVMMPLEAKQNMDPRYDFIPQIDGKLGEDRNHDVSVCVTHSTSHGRGKHIGYMFNTCTSQM